MMNLFGKSYWEKKGNDYIAKASYYRRLAEKFEREAEELLRKARKSE